MVCVKCGVVGVDEEPASRSEKAINSVGQTKVKSKGKNTSTTYFPIYWERENSTKF